MSREVAMQFGKSNNVVRNNIVGFEVVLLWTNPDVSENFNAQTISIDLSEYDAVYVIAGTTAGTSYAQALIPIGVSAGLRYSSYSGANLQYRTRSASASNTGVTFGSGERRTQGTNSTTTNNADAIPSRIYGIKFG